MPSKAYLIISGSKFYLENHSVVAAWKGLFSTGSYPCTRRTPLVNLGFFLQALSPAGPSFKISFCALPALPQACRPLMLLTMKNTWTLCKLCSSFSPPTLPGITPHMLLTHTGESIQRPTSHAQVLVASPHYSLSLTHSKHLLYPVFIVLHSLLY